MSWKLSIKPGIGQRLKEERLRLGLSQEKFGQAVGVSKVTIYTYEQERSSMDIDMLSRLSRIGVDLSTLLSGAAPEFVTSTHSLTLDKLVSAFPKLLQYFRANHKAGDDPQVIRALLTGIALRTDEPEKISVQPKATAKKTAKQRGKAAVKSTRTRRS